MEIKAGLRYSSAQSKKQRHVHTRRRMYKKLGKILHEKNEVNIYYHLPPSLLSFLPPFSVVLQASLTYNYLRYSTRAQHHFFSLISLTVCLSDCLSSCLSVFLSFCQFVLLSICLSVRLFFKFWPYSMSISLYVLSVSWSFFISEFHSFSVSLCLFVVNSNWVLHTPKTAHNLPFPCFWHVFSRFLCKKLKKYEAKKCIILVYSQVLGDAKTLVKHFRK